MSYNVEDVENFGEEKGESQIEERLLLPTSFAEDEIPLEVGVDDVASVGADHISTVLFGVYADLTQLVSAWVEGGGRN